MPLATTLAEYIRAAFSGLYLETQEPAEALRELGDICRQEHWTLATWDIDQGLRLVGGANPVGTAATDPLAALRSLPALATPEGTTLLVLSNFHRFLNSAEIVQALQHQLQAGKANRTFVVILAPTVQLPPELERQFVVLTHDLPHREQLAQIAHEL
ncbi:MAG TPA: AAA family ATPase, partial [Planctomycetaceae bacterium]|nr:AAA family ATPase [Planctomycetaceae bacterium]